MMITATIPSLLAIGCYLLAGLLRASYLFRPEHTLNAALAMTVGLIAVLAHAFSIANIIYIGGQFDVGIFSMLSLVFCAVTAITLLIGLARPLNNLLVFLCPMAALSLAMVMTVPDNFRLLTSISLGLFAHILSSILAYSFLAIATVQAVALALQERQLKRRAVGGILKVLPPLQTMERLLFELAWVGVILLTLSLLSGFIFLDDIFAQRLINKTFFSILAWLLFVVLLWGRHYQGWRSQTATRWTLGGFVALMVAYFGSKLVLEVLLG